MNDSSERNALFSAGKSIERDVLAPSQIAGADAAEIEGQQAREPLPVAFDEIEERAEGTRDR